MINSCARCADSHVCIIYYPGQNNRYSRDIHEIDPQCDHVISRDIDFESLQRELATRRYRESRRCRTEARYRTISHDRTVDQPHEFLGCNDFFGQSGINSLAHLSFGQQPTMPCNLSDKIEWTCRQSMHRGGQGGREGRGGRGTKQNQQQLHKPYTGLGKCKALWGKPRTSNFVAS